VLAGYTWPGNVRQLRNEIQRAVALSLPGGTIAADHLSPELVRTADPMQPSAAGVRAVGAHASLAAAVEQVERDLIRTTMDRTRGNISETARLLGLTRRGQHLDWIPTDQLSLWLDTQYSGPGPLAKTCKAA
jgi:DNA-binding NtrC family response regulator